MHLGRLPCSSVWRPRAGGPCRRALALDAAAASLVEEGVALDGVQALLNRTVTANCFDDCSLTPTRGGSSKRNKKDPLSWLNDLEIILPVCAGLLLILVGVLGFHCNFQHGQLMHVGMVYLDLEHQGMHKD